MINSLLKNRRGSLKQKPSGKFLLITKRKMKSNSFIKKKKIKEFGAKRFYITKKSTYNTLNEVNPQIKKIKHLISTK